MCWRESPSLFILGKLSFGTTTHTNVEEGLLNTRLWRRSPRHWLTRADGRAEEEAALAQSVEWGGRRRRRRIAIAGA